jgi:stress response protein YsnF
MQNTERQRKISKHGWHLDHERDDVRGWPVHDAYGNTLGTVKEMCVDPRSASVMKVELEDGKFLNAHQLRKGKHELLLEDGVNAPGAAPSSDDVVVQLVGEELEVGKRRSEADGVHLQTRIVGEPVSKQVLVAEERVTVERTKVDRDLPAAEADALLRDETHEVRTVADTPVTQRSAHVVEEIVVKKETTDHDETVRDNLRQMEASVTELPPDPALARKGARR